MIIQHNMSAMNAKRQMGISTGALNKNTEKLSSGYKINRAGDDAAGLSISEKMRAQIRGLDRASSNSQDGISLIQTAEGALNETHSILQRMRELAVQSASDTNTNTDKQKIQDEIDQLTQEVDRIANTTEFNTKKLLNGDQEGAKEAVKGSAEINGNFVNGNVGVSVKGDINTSLSDVIRLTVKGLGDSTVTNAQGKASDGTIRVNVETLFGMDSDDTDIVYESNSVPKGGQYKVDPELKMSGKTAVSTVKLHDGVSVEYSVTKNDGTTATSEISGINKADIQADGSVYIETENGGRYSVNLGNGVVTDLKTNAVAQDVFYNDADRTITLKSGATGTTAQQKLQVNITVKDANGKLLTSGTDYNVGANKTSNTTVTMKDSKTIISADGVVKPPKIETVNTTASTSGSTTATKGDTLAFEFEGRKYSVKLDNTGKISTVTAMSGTKSVSIGTIGTDIILRSGATVNGEKTFSIELQKNPSISGSSTASDTPSAVITITAKMSGSKSASTGDRFAAGATHNVTITTTTPRTADNEVRDYGDSQKINTKSDATNGYMDLKADANGNISFTFGGATVTINDADKLKVGDTVTLKVTGNQEAAAVNDINKDGIKLQIGANASQEMQMRISSMKASALNIANAKGEALDVTKQSSASMAIEAYDMAIQKVSKERAKMGAIQNRLEHTIANLDTASENLQSAESRIRDTDMAKEMTQYSKNNILMQAGQSMLAQANQQTQGVLTLLR